MSESEMNQHTVQGINGFWIQARAEWESENAALVERNSNLEYELRQYQWNWKESENDRQRLRAAIVQMIGLLSGDNFRSQQMAHARSVGEKALNGRYGV